MTSTRSVGRTVVGVCAFACLLAFPIASAAQSSTFPVPFDRTGAPGTSTIDVIDPVTLQPVPTVVETGAFVNPCTLENVDVTGTSTITTLQTVDKFGTTKVNVSVSTKATGFGWVLNGTEQFFTGSNYTYTDSQQFTYRLPSSGEEFSSDFTDRLSLKGAKSIDNWNVRAHFKIKVSPSGVVQVLLIKMTADDGCKG